MPRRLIAGFPRLTVYPRPPIGSKPQPSAEIKNVSQIHKFRICRRFGVLYGKRPYKTQLGGFAHRKVI